MSKALRKKAKRRLTASTKTAADSGKIAKLERQVQRLEEKVQVLEADQRLNHLKLAIFKEISRITDHQIDFDRLLSRTMDLVLKALKTESGTLFTVDEAAQELVFRVVKGSK